MILKNNRDEKVGKFIALSLTAYFTSFFSSNIVKDKISENKQNQNSWSSLLILTLTSFALVSDYVLFFSSLPASIDQQNLFLFFFFCLVLSALLVNIATRAINRPTTNKLIGLLQLMIAILACWYVMILKIAPVFVLAIFFVVFFTIALFVLKNIFVQCQDRFTASSLAIVATVSGLFFPVYFLPKTNLGSALFMVSTINLLFATLLLMEGKKRFAFQVFVIFLVSPPLFLLQRSEQMNEVNNATAIAPPSAIAPAVTCEDTFKTFLNTKTESTMAVGVDCNLNHATVATKESDLKKEFYDQKRKYDIVGLWVSKKPKKATIRYLNSLKKSYKFIVTKNINKTELTIASNQALNLK